MNTEAATAGQPVTVALLEDQRVLRDSIADVLSQNGYKIRLSCGHPDELLGALALHRPQVCVMDLRLTVNFDAPAEEGWRTVRFVRQWYPDVKVVVLTGTHDPQDIDRAQHEGVAAFLSKDSISTQELLDALGRVSRGERVFPVTTSFLAPSRHMPETPEPVKLLTTRELEVLRYVASGYDNMKIAACMNISERTVRAHVSNLYRKLGPENRAQLALMARELGVKPATD